MREGAGLDSWSARGIGIVARQKATWPLTSVPDEICIEAKLRKTLGMIHHTRAASHVAEDNDGDRATFWRSYDMLVYPNCEENEQERHEDGDDSDKCFGRVLGHCISRKELNYVNTSASLFVHNHNARVELAERNSTDEFAARAIFKFCTALMGEVRLLYA